MGGWDDAPFRALLLRGTGSMAGVFGCGDVDNGAGGYLAMVVRGMGRMLRREE